MSPVNKMSISRGLNYRHRPRSNSAGQETKVTNKALGLDSMTELGIELQRFHELSSAFYRGEKDEASSEKKTSLTKSKTHHFYKQSQSSRFDECTSTVVTRVPNKSVEDLYSLDQTSKSLAQDDSHIQDQFDETSGLVSSSLSDSAETIAALSLAVLSGDKSSHVMMTYQSPSESYPAASDDDSLSSCSSPVKGVELIGSTFGVIKDISVSNIHSNESDKTKDFLSKDLTSIFSSWDSDISNVHVSTDSGCARRPLTLENSSGRGMSVYTSSGTPLIKSCMLEAETSVRGGSNKPVTSHTSGISFGNKDDQTGGDKTWSWLSDSQLSEHILSDENISNEQLQPSSLMIANQDFSLLDLGKIDRNSKDIFLLKMAENMVHMTTFSDSYTKEQNRIHGSDMTANDDSVRAIGSPLLSSDENILGKPVKNIDSSMMDRQRRFERIIDKDTCDVEQHRITDQEKKYVHLPRTAWAVEENEEVRSTKLSPASLKTNKKSIPPHKTKVFDFDSAHRKSQHKSSSKSRKTKGAKVALCLMHDVGDHVCEVPLNQRLYNELQSDSQTSGFRLNVTRASEIAPSLYEHNIATGMSSSNILSCEDGLVTSENSLSNIGIQNVWAPITEIDSSVGSQTSSVSQTNDTESLCLSTEQFLMLTSDIVTTDTAVLSSPVIAKGGEDAEMSELSDSNCVEYSLTRNISFDRLSHYSVYTAGISDSENHMDVADLEIREGSDDDDGDDEDNNVLVKSALNADAYETAASDDNWEDASSVLPLDNTLLVNESLECAAVDDSDLHSLYV